MKRLFLLVASVLLGGQAMAQQSVQGIDRPDLQGRKEIRKATLPERANASFTFDDIDFWVGDGPNKAAMVISWHDAVDDQPDHLVWGYRWLDGDTATGYKMLTAIAAKDPRFLALTQLTNLGYTIDGLGYDVAGRDTSTFKLKYVLGQEDPFVLGASTDTRVSFKFDTPNTTMGQYACPQNPLESANAAIQTGLATGIIEHPFNYGNYGYACYDYDYWQVDTVSYGGTPTLHWKAGWYNGYWSYFGGDGNPNSWSYSSWGASMRELNNGDWDGWSYNGDMNNWEGTLPGTDLVAAPAVVKVDKKSANISRGSTLNLSLTFDDKYTSGKNVVWTVSDSRVIRITSSDDNSVQIRAMSSGTAYVKATVDGYSAFCDITVAGNTRDVSINEQENVFYSNGTLHIKDLEGYTAYISSISGSVVSNFRITSADEVKSLNLNPGIYSVTAVKGAEKVATKFVVK